ncbi:penicillin-binding transpeptidase domain-containing protein [Salinifilum aidingensis]
MRSTGTRLWRTAARSLGVGAALLLAIPLAGCGPLGGPSEEDAARAFLTAMTTGKPADAANRTTDPDAARTAIAQSRQGLDAESVRAQLREVTENDRGQTVAHYGLRWDFGQGEVWRYDASALLVPDEEQGWKVRWSPKALHPRLAQGQSLAFHEERPDPAPVYDRSGDELMTPQRVVTVQLDPRAAGDVPAVAGELAGALGGVAPGVTQQSITEGVRQTPEGQPYTVVSLRDADYRQVRDSIHDLPGVRFPSRTQLVTVDRSMGTQTLSGITERVDEQVKANAGWRVVAQQRNSGARAATLHEVRPRPVQPVRTTLDAATQRAAEGVLDQHGKSAMLVAMRPSDGEIVTIAQNDAADASGPVALTGQYPPGSTFKMVTATAALSAQGGRLTPDTPVACPPRKTFNGRVLPNEDEFDLGRVPLHTAFAQSCNTTFAQLAADQPADALPKTARKLGVGADFRIPGATTITGSVEASEEVVGRAENGIGQGTVLASPFGMALATSTIAGGEMPTPKLVRDAPTETTKPAGEPPPPQVLDQVRGMMREVVTSGTASGLSGSGEVHGKTGTAQYGDGSHAHGWFTGYRGDLAFAVLLTDAGSSKPAVSAAGDFLGAIG